MIKILIAIFRLIRYPNLFFIGLTQWMFYFFIVKPVLLNSNFKSILNANNIWLLIIASILIAASGYIINDYFDLNIDRVNKPDKLVIGRLIKKRSAIIWHWFFSILGLVFSILFSMNIENYLPAIINLFTIILLWFYSASLKQKPLIGNVLISMLTSWVVFSVYFSLDKELILNPTSEFRVSQSLLFKFTILYAGFAFMISLIREIVKDLEDMEGDAKYGCLTLPLIWGVKPTLIFISTWIVIALSSMIILQIYVLQLHWWTSVAYSLIAVIFPLIKVFILLQKARSKNDFHNISLWLKLIMLMGILSMLFVSLYL